jgi:glycine cleavage system H protein
VIRRPGDPVTEKTGYLLTRSPDHRYKGGHMTPDDLKYYKEHEWVRVDGSIAVVGITDYAQDALGDVVYVDLPEKGTALEAGSVIGEIESVKSTSELHTPVSGTVVELNEQAVDKPETINDDPYGNGWLVKIELKDPTELDNLMSAEEYDKYTEEL